MSKSFHAPKKKSIIGQALARIEKHEEEYRSNYIELLNLEHSLTFESLTRKQQLKHYGTTELKNIVLN